MCPPAQLVDAPRNSWIISPVWDLAVLVASPLLIAPLVWVLVRGAMTPEHLAVLVASFASLGHHLPGFLRCYGDRQLFERFRWRFLLAPPVLLATTLLFTVTGYHGLQLVLVVWGLWHGLMQTYGFMRIYDVKRGVTDAWTSHLDFVLCLLIFAGGCVFSDARVYGIMSALWRCGVPYLDVIWLVRVRWLVAIAAVVVGGAYMLHFLRNRYSSCGSSWTKLLLAITTGLLYWTAGSLTTNLLVGVAMFEIFHAAQYYAIVWVYNRRLADRVGPEFGPLGFLFRGGWKCAGLYLAAIVAYGCIRYFGDDLNSEAAGKFVLAVIAASTLLHYYFDGFIWKVSEASTNVNLGVESAGKLQSPITVSSLKHLAKWSAIGSLLIGLSVMERRMQPQGERWLEARLAAWTPQLPEVQMMIGDQALEKGATQQAITAFRNALQLRNSSAPAHAGLANALIEDDQVEAAVEHYQQAIRLAPDVWLHQFNLASAYQLLRRFEDAELAMMRAAELGAGEDVVQRELAEIYLQQGRNIEAAKSYAIAIERRPDASAIRAGFVHCLSKLRKLDQAVRVATAEGYSESPEVKLALAAAYNAAGRSSEAIEVLMDIMEQASTAEPHFQMGLAQLQAGRFDLALDSLERAIRMDADHAMAHFQLGNVHYLAGRPAAAEQCYVRTLELRPEFPDALSNLGASLMEEMRFQEAIDIYQRLLASGKGNHALVHFNLGMLYLDLGQNDEARRHFQQAADKGYPLPVEISILLSADNSRSKRDATAKPERSD